MVHLLLFHLVILLRIKGYTHEAFLKFGFKNIVNFRIAGVTSKFDFTNQSMYAKILNK